MDWASFFAGFTCASILSVVIACGGYVLDQRRRAREIFSAVESPSGKQTRRLRAREKKLLAKESRDE